MIRMSLPAGVGPLVKSIILQIVALVGLVFLPVFLLLGLDWALFAVLLALLAMHCWNLFQLRRLLHWISGPLDDPLPEAHGLWGEVFIAQHRRMRKRLQKERSLSERLERFIRAFQALPDGVIAFDGQQHIEWLNAQAEAHFALSAGSDLGRALTNLIRHPDFVNYLEAGDFKDPLVVAGVRVPGVTLLIQIIPYDEGKKLLISRDISQLERIERMRRDFIANVSHELKTPLTVSAGFSEMLADDFKAFSDEEVSHYLGLICAQNARMQRLIEDLLTLSALESGGAPPRQEKVDMALILQGVLHDAQVLSGGRHEVCMHFSGPAQLLGCNSELRSALGNLAGNAVRYTPEGGRIELFWQSLPDGAEFSVRDTGIGIAPEHIPRLTERFYRVDRGRSRETGGTGLGLAIVKHVLTRHGATLHIDSVPGIGSTFTVRFPSSALAVTQAA